MSLTQMFKTLAVALKPSIYRNHGPWQQLKVRCGGDSYISPHSHLRYILLITCAVLITNDLTMLLAALASLCGIKTFSNYIQFNLFYP